MGIAVTTMIWRSTALYTEKGTETRIRRRRELHARAHIHTHTFTHTFTHSEGTHTQAKSAQAGSRAQGAKAGESGAGRQQNTLTADEQACCNARTPHGPARDRHGRSWCDHKWRKAGKSHAARRVRAGGGDHAPRRTSAGHSRGRGRGRSVKRRAMGEWRTACRLEHRCVRRAPKP